MSAMRRRGFTCRRAVLVIAILVVLSITATLLFKPQLHAVLKEVHRLYGTSVDTEEMMKDKFTACGGEFIGYGHEFAVLHDAIIKPGDDKFYIPCGSGNVPDYLFNSGKEGTHLNEWMRNTITYEPDYAIGHVENLEVSKKSVGVIVMRYEYANLYHTMTDWFNVFMVVKRLNVPFSDVRVMWYNTHAKGHLDETWNTLFGEIIAKPDLKHPVLFKTMIWSILGYESPLNYHSNLAIPYLDDFHSFFLKQHGIEETKKLNCNQVSILFLWRRDYYAHPNNPSGRISRKIKNEDELIAYISKQYPAAKVSGKQLDTLNFKEQLQVITQTDILISMHGAGLSHNLFLPKHGGVLEIYTQYWLRSAGTKHFDAMARWRGLIYDFWQNFNPSNELKDMYTYIPPSSLDLKFNGIYKKLCP